MADMERFSSLLRKYRRERGITQNELAERLMVSPQSVSVWESGKGMPDVDHLCELSRALSVSIDVLLGNRPDRMRTYIGIDGSGTKTEFALVDETGHCLNRVVLEGSNPNTVGIDKAVQILRQGLDFLRPGEMNVASIFFGGAGMDRETSNRDEVCTALRRAYPGICIECENDIYNVIICSSRPDNCIAVNCGTGCIVFSSVDGQIIRTGGAGHLFGGGGSGYDIGRDAVNAALESRDGMLPPTLLIGLVEEKLGGSAWERIHELYKKNVPYIASFAPLVFRAAKQGDRTAREILERNCDYVARLIRRSRERADNKPDRVILSGSVFAQNDAFYQMLIQRLGDGLVPERLECPPVWGACLQAAKACGADRLPELRQFLNSWEKL